MPYFLFKKQNEYSSASLIITALLAGLIAIYFGFRPASVGSDTPAYIEIYDSSHSYPNFLAYLEDYNYIDIFYYTLNYILQPVLPVQVFFTLINLFNFFAFIYFVYTYYGRALIFPFFVAYIGLFFMVSMQVNIVRTSVAIACVFLFLSLKQKKKALALLFLLVAILNHITTSVLLIAYLISKLGKSSLPYYLLWMVCLILAINNIGILELPVIKQLISDSEKFYVYLLEDPRYETGFRLNFTVFNFIFIVVGYFAYLKKKTPDYFRMYLALSSLFLLWYQLPYSDRIGLYSWIFIPFICLDFSRMNVFRNYHLSHWVFYLFIIILGASSYFLVPK